jgi:hypothetical protein
MSENVSFSLAPRVRSWDSTSRNRPGSLAPRSARSTNMMSGLGLNELAPGRNTADTLCDAKRLYLQGEHTAC